MENFRALLGWIAVIIMVVVLGVTAWMAGATRDPSSRTLNISLAFALMVICVVAWRNSRKHSEDLRVLAGGGLSYGLLVILSCLYHFFKIRL